MLARTHARTHSRTHARTQLRTRLHLHVSGLRRDQPWHRGGLNLHAGGGQRAQNCGRTTHAQSAGRCRQCAAAGKTQPTSRPRPLAPAFAPFATHTQRTAPYRIASHRTCPRRQHQQHGGVPHFDHFADGEIRVSRMEKRRILLGPSPIAGTCQVVNSVNARTNLSFTHRKAQRRSRGRRLWVKKERWTTTGGGGARDEPQATGAVGLSSTRVCSPT